MYGTFWEVHVTARDMSIEPHTQERCMLVSESTLQKAVNKAVQRCEWEKMTDIRVSNVYKTNIDCVIE